MCLRPGTKLYFISWILYSLSLKASFQRSFTFCLVFKYPVSFPFLPITFLHHLTMAVKQHRLIWTPGKHSLNGAALPLPTEHSLANQGAPAPATEALLASIRGHDRPPLKERDQVSLSWCSPEVGNGPQNPCQQGCCRHSL